MDKRSFLKSLLALAALAVVKPLQMFAGLSPEEKLKQKWLHFIYESVPRGMPLIFVKDGESDLRHRGRIVLMKNESGAIFEVNAEGNWFIQNYELDIPKGNYEFEVLNPYKEFFAHIKGTKYRVFKNQRP